MATVEPFFSSFDFKVFETCLVVDTGKSIHARVHLLVSINPFARRYIFSNQLLRRLQSRFAIASLWFSQHQQLLLGRAIVRAFVACATSTSESAYSVGGVVGHLRGNAETVQRVATCR